MDRYMCIYTHIYIYIYIYIYTNFTYYNEMMSIRILKTIFRNKIKLFSK